MGANDTPSNLTKFLHVLSIEEKITNVLFIYVAPCVIFIGTIANILSIIVLSKKSMRGSTTLFYLLILSIADLMVLYTGLLRYWILRAFELDIRLYNDMTCKGHVFIVYFSLDIASWILVAVTIDRCVSVMIPLKAKIYCTSKTSKVVIITIFVTMAIINGQLFVTVQINKENGKVDCGPTEATLQFISQVWPWIDFAVFCFVPFGIMIIANIFIIRKIAESTKMLKNMPDVPRKSCKSSYTTRRSQISKTDVSTSSHLDRQRSGFSKHIYHIQSFKIEDSREGTNKAVCDIISKASTNVTIMLLAVNMVFLLCTTPIAIYFIGKHYWKTTGEWTHQRKAILNLVYSIVNILQYINNAIHFFLYCFTGTRFRNEFFKIFTRRRHTTAASLQYS